MHTTIIEYITFTPWTAHTPLPPTVTIASDHALTVLPARVGPTATLLLHRTVRLLDGHEWTEWARYDDIATELGVATKVLIRAIERLIRFGYAHWADVDCTVLQVATHITRG